MKFVPLSEADSEVKSDGGNEAEGLTFTPLERPEPKAKPKAKPYLEGDYDFDSGEGTGLDQIALGKPTPKRQSVLQGQDMPGPLPTEDKYVVRPEFVNAVQAQLDAVPAEQRQAALAKLVERSDVYGRAARAIAGRYEALDKVTLQKLRERTDPRLEVQTKRFEEQGLRPEIAAGQARLQALQGKIKPDFQQMNRDVVGEQAAAEASKRAEELEDAGFWKRVGSGVTSEYTKAGLGLLSAYADLTGDDQFSRDLVSARRIEDARGKAIPEGKSIFERSAQGAMTSLGTQAPFLALSVATGTAAPVLAQAAIQQFGDSYSEGRAAGLSGEAATARAVPMAAAEVIFERLGMTKALSGLKAYIAKNGVRGIPEYMAKAVVSEIPPEMATTLTQYGIDVLPGIGTNKNPSLLGLYQQLEETLRQTILQAGATAGGTIAATKGAQKGAEALGPLVSPETRQRLEAFTGPREGGYQRDESFEGLAELQARAKGFLTPQQRQQRQEQEDLGDVGTTRPGDERQFTFTPLDEFEPEKATSAEAREQEVSKRAAEIEATGIPADDARELAENEVAEQEKKNAAQSKRLATQAPSDRVSQIAQDLITAGEDPQRAILKAFQQAREEAEADALFKEQEKEAKLEAKRAKEEKKNAGQPITKPTGTSTSVAGQPGAKPPAGRPTGVITGRVVPSGQDVTGTTAGETTPSAAVSFTTSKGSEYTVDEEGKTSRTKKSEGAGQGTTYAPHTALYVNPGDNNEILSDMQGGMGGNSVRLGYISDSKFTPIQNVSEIPEGGKPTVMVVNKKDSQIVGVYKAETTPQVGLHPVEKLYNADGTASTHVGNAIVSINTIGAQVGTQTTETVQATQKGQAKPRASRATGKPRGRPAVLTEEERKQKRQESKPVQAEKKRADDAVTRINKALTKLAQPMDESIYANDEEVKEAEQKRRDEKRGLIKELLALQQSPNLRGTAVSTRIKEALNHPSITAKEKADVQAGLAATKTAGPATSAVTIAKGPADHAFSKFKNGVQALSHIIKTGDAFQQKLGRRLRGFVNGVKFVVIEKGDELPDQLKKTKNAEQWDRSIALYIENYRTGDKVIYVRGASFGVDQGVNNTTIMHELLHAATNRKLALAYAMIQKGLNLDSAVVRAAQDLIRTMNSAGTLFNELSANGTLTKEMSVLASHGEIFDDPREFVAYGMTDPAMQKFLMQAHGYEEDTSFFNRFVTGIRDLMGMSDDDTNAMTDLIIVTDKLLSSRTPAWAKLSGEIASSSIFGGGREGDKEIKAKPSANVQRLAKMLGNKLYGTPDDIAKVSVKELFQNSFDAIKEALEKGQLKKGKIDVSVNSNKRTISVVDNGPGMPTSVMGNQFLQIAGTVKGTARASGGLGVAKMLFLFENKQLEVVSLRDGVVSRMVTTGDDLKAALDDPDRGPTITTSTDPDTVSEYEQKYFPDGHGTAVIVQIPEKYTDESTGEEKDITFSDYYLERAPVLTESPLFDDIDVTFNDGYRTKTLPLGANFPIDEYTSFANVRFAWGVARIYVSKELKEQEHWPRKNAHVLSNGLWQFDISIKDRPGYNGKEIKRNFFIDVSPDPHVKPEDAGYPFELNRQGFSKVAQEDFNKITNYITAIYSQLDLAAGIRNFGDVQYVNPDGTLSAKEVLEPKVPLTDTAFTLIKPGDKVEVKDGVLYVNNRQVPELTNDDLKNVSIRIDELTIPQNELDPDRVMIHDNTVIGIPNDADKLREFLIGLGWQISIDSRSHYVAYKPNGEEYSGEWMDDLIKNMQAAGALPADISLSDAARAEFGVAYDKYLAGVGQTFLYLRNALIAAGRGEYGDLATQVVGTSIDNEYYGVNVMLPFKGMFINPSVTNLSGTPQEIALSMIGTMIHELAHFKVRNHGAEFPSEMQKIMVLLEVFPSFDMRQVQKALTDHIAANIDIFRYLEKEFKSGNLKPRGNRFKDASAEEISDESAPKPMGSISQTGEGRSSLSAITGEGTEDTGEVVDDSGDDNETEAVRGSVRSQKEVDKKVAEVGEQFSESVKGDKFAKGISLLQMAQDPKQVIPALRAIWNRITVHQRNLLVRYPTTDFLVQWAANAVPELMHTNVLLQKMNGMTLQFLKSSGELVADIDRAFRADKTLRAKLDRIAFESTLAEVDPSNPSADERSAALDKQYADLGVEGQRLFVQIKQHFERLSAYFTKLLDDQITKSNMSIAQQANLMKKIRAIYEQGGKISPYFPLVREGDYWLAIGKGKTRKFFMFESMAERDNAMQGFADERVKQKPGESWDAYQKRRAANLEELITDKEFVFDNDISSLRRISSDSSILLREIFDAIDSSNLGDADSKDKLKDAVYQVYLQAMPDQSFRKQFIHRKGVTGFRPDLLRNVAHTTTKMATQLARIKYAPLLRNSLSAARDSIENRPRYTPFVAEMERRVTDELSFNKDTTGNAIAGALNKASFIWYLGGASSALLQPLSLFQTGMPVLWKYGTIGATREMSRMIKMWGQFGVYKKNADGTTSWVAPSVEYAKGMTPDERRAIRDMLSRDVATSTYASSIFDYKATPTDKRSGPVMSFGKNTVDVLVLGGLMHSTERISREMMFLSSYRLNREMMAKGSMTPAEAHDAAVNQAVMDTNEALGNYGQYNRPMFMKSAPGKVLTQFMMYPVHVTLYLLRNFMEMIKPMAGKTREEAIKKFFGTLGTTFVLAGASGLPMFSTIMGLIGAAWEKMRGDADWPKELKDLSFELWFRTVWLEEQLGGTKIGGKKLSEIVDRGLANALTGLDIAGRTSLNNMWLRDTKEPKTVREGAMALALEKAGPSANMVLSWFEAYEAFRQGDYDKGVSRALPAGFRNFKTSFDLFKEGAKDNKGTQILSKDAFSTGQLIFQAVGFRSDLLANTQYVTFKVIGLEQKILNERTQLLNRLDREFREKDFKGFSETLGKRINKFNREYPSYALEADDVTGSIESRAEQRAESYRGVKLTEKNVPVFIKALRPSREAATEAEKKGREK
jgi:signal peptidase I